MHSILRIFRGCLALFSEMQFSTTFDCIFFFYKNCNSTLNKATETLITVWPRILLRPNTVSCKKKSSFSFLLAKLSIQESVVLSYYSLDLRILKMDVILHLKKCKSKDKPSKIESQINTQVLWNNKLLQNCHQIVILKYFQVIDEVCTIKL